MPLTRVWPWALAVTLVDAYVRGEPVDVPQPCTHNRWWEPVAARRGSGIGGAERSHRLTAAPPVARGQQYRLV